MSEADRLFEELGYKKTINFKEIVYENGDKIITFNLDKKSITCTNFYDGFESIDMQELQAINMKVKELRLDMILILVILNYINDCKKIRKEKLAVSLSARLFSYFLCVPLPTIVALILGGDINE